MSVALLRVDELNEHEQSFKVTQPNDLSRANRCLIDNVRRTAEAFARSTLGDQPQTPAVLDHHLISRLSSEATLRHLTLAPLRAADEEQILEISLRAAR